MTRKTKRTRRRFTADEKATILRRHMADKVPVSDLGDEYGLQPSARFTWQRILFESDRSAKAGGHRGSGLAC